MRLGRYQLLKRIAVGGMAEIFIAKETGLAGFQRTAVVKRILPQLSLNDEFVQLFLDEARLAARLSHPNIVHIYELGLDEGSYFIAMEFVPGCDLGTLLSSMGGPLPIGDALHIITDVLEGLHFAHALCDVDGEPIGVVHRDVAPKNILLSVAGAVKIVDFGIAKARTKVSVTVPGRVMGTVGYMSPEQAAGKAVDRRTDIFATGAMLYRMVTGQEAFPGRSAVTIGYGHVPKPRSPREIKKDIPERVESIIMAAMAMDPDDRYGTAAQMRRDVASTALKLGLTADPDLLAGLVKTFRPDDHHDVSVELSSELRHAAAAEDEPSGSLEQNSVEISNIVVVDEVSEELEPSEESSDEHRSSGPPKLYADELEVDDADETVAARPKRKPITKDEPPPEIVDRRKWLEVPLTVEARAVEETTDSSVDILDDPPRDTMVDLGDTIEAGIDVTGETASIEAVLPRFEEPATAEKTIDESTSVELDFNEDDDEERTTIPESRSSSPSWRPPDEE